MSSAAEMEDTLRNFQTRPKHSPHYRRRNAAALAQASWANCSGGYLHP